MKKSIVTGSIIFTAIEKLKAEIADLEEACDELEEGAAYNILYDARSEKKSELNTLMNQQYEKHLGHTAHSGVIFD